MRNKDINSRFEDWLLNPSEALDFEVKRWLDLEDAEGRGAVAKALIALENHGGGYLLIGYRQDEDNRLVPDENRPATLNAYSTDAINAIIKKCAEPVFHADVTFQKHPETGDEFPLIRVSGSSRVPVRSCSATAGKTLHQNIYYIRRPGPESDSPKTGAEWDQLLRRCVLAQREEIIAVLRAFLPTGGTLVLPPSEQEKLREFCKAAATRWTELNNSLAEAHPSKIKLGHFVFSARILGTSRSTPAREILGSLERAKRYTGWPPFVVLHQENSRPKLVDGCLEAWLADLKYPDSAHADFWRIDPKGSFYLLRGMQEDSLDPAKGFGPPGTLFDITLPIWRLGEFLLRIIELGAVMFEEKFEVAVDCEWTGLRGRTLTVISRERRVPGTYRAEQNTVHTSGQFSQAVIRDLLPDVVKSLTSPVYEVFDFFQPSDSVYAEEISDMTKSRF